LERFAIQVSTSGLRPRIAKEAFSATGEILQCEPRIALRRGEDVVLPEVGGGERALLTKGRHLRERVEAEVAPLELAFAEVSPLVNVWTASRTWFMKPDDSSKHTSSVVPSKRASNTARLLAMRPVILVSIVSCVTRLKI